MIEYFFRFSDFPRDDSDTLRHNIVAHIFDGVLYTVATGFISVQTVLPVFVQSLGGGTIAIGSVAVLWTLGGNLPQVFVLPLTHRPGPVKPVMLRTSFVLRALFLVLGLFTLVGVGRIFVPLSLIIVLALIGVTAVSMSIAVPPWFQLFTKTVPVTLRGRLLAFRQMVGSGLGIVAGSIVVFILAEIKAPLSFALLFFLAFVSSMASFYYLTRIKELPGMYPSEFDETVQFRGKALSILKNDRNFRNFLYVDALLLMGMTGIGFYAVYGLEKFNLPVSSAGTFTSIAMASMVAASLLFGHLADVHGHKINIILIALSVSSASFLAVAAANVFVYWAVFFFMACAIALQGISRMPFVAEMCSHDERPYYVALTNTITAPTVIVGILAGALIKHIGYDLVFVCYGIVGLVAAVWMWKRVDEVRVNPVA